MNSDLVTLVKLGDKEIKVSKLAQIVFYIGMVSAIMIILTVLMSPKVSVVYTVTSILVAIVSWLLLTYTSNCMVVGQCNMYVKWVVIPLSVLYLVMSTISFSILVFYRSKMVKKSVSKK